MADVDLDHLPPLPADRSVGIGCIGAGFIMADCHLVAYRAAGLNPVAIAARRPVATAEVAARHAIPRAYDDHRRLLDDPAVEVVDIAVPPDVQPAVIEDALDRRDRIRGILAQKPLATNYAEASRLVERCRAAGVRLVVNQNMRHDHAVRGCGSLLQRGVLGDPVLATIEMRAVPHWMPWQERLGWVTLRIMSIHHLDTFRHWFGTPRRVIASVRPDPRTARQFAHEDGIVLVILEYNSGLRCLTIDDVWAGPAREGAEADLGVRFRVEGTAGMAPLRSHLSYLFDTLETGRRVSFWYGARSRQELFYVEYFQDLARRFPNFRFEIALSEPLPDDEWTGRVGFIHDVLERDYLAGHPQPGAVEYYLCGPPAMIEAARRMLARRGIDPKQVAFDEF